jgi:hypothetical protein
VTPSAQDDVNRKQGDVNRKQGDLNDEQADVNAALAADYAARGTQLDAEHAEQAAINADAADETEQRDAEHAAQRVINVAAEATTVRRDADHAEQIQINAAAVLALQAVGEAAVELSDMLRQNVARGKRWTVALTTVVAVIVIMGVFGAFQVRANNERANEQRTVIREQAEDQCLAAAERTRAIRTELTFLVTAAVGDSPNPEAAKFLADYPKHLNEVLVPPDCRQR